MTLQSCQTRQKLFSPVVGCLVSFLGPEKGRFESRPFWCAVSWRCLLGPAALLLNNMTGPALLPFRLTSRSKSVDKSHEEFPKELMEDWSTMEVCVDCKKFISEIINSSRRSLSLANKRARLKRKTQSFYMSSPGTSEYCPSERTINEIWALCLFLCFCLHEVIIHEQGYWNWIIIPLLCFAWLAWICRRSQDFLLHRFPEMQSAVLRLVRDDTQRVSCSHWEKINSLKLLPLLYVCVETRKPFLAFNLFLTMLWIIFQEMSWKHMFNGEPT